MSKVLCTLFGAGLCAIVTMAQADTLEPTPSNKTTLPSLPTSSVEVQQSGNRALPNWVDTKLATSTAAQADISAFGTPCTINLQAAPLADAMFAVKIDAPCRPYENLTIEYAGLTFDIMMSVTGQATFDLPAMATSARLAAIFEDKAERALQLETPDLSGFARVAVAWSQALGMRLTASAPRDVQVTFYTLGEEDLRSIQILSHHQRPDMHRAVIRLGVSASITPQNCGQERHATVRHLQPDMPPISYELMIAPTRATAPFASTAHCSAMTANSTALIRSMAP